MNGRRDEELGEQEEGVKQAARGQLIARFLKIKCFIEVEVELIYNVVLISTVQQNESTIHIHSSPPYWIPSHSGHHRTLSRSPCAIQYVLISYSLYI